MKASFKEIFSLKPKKDPKAVKFQAPKIKAPYRAQCEMLHAKRVPQQLRKQKKGDGKKQWSLQTQGCRLFPVMKLFSKEYVFKAFMGTGQPNPLVLF